MSLNVQPIIPSGITNGIPVVIGTSATTVHTATSESGKIDQLDLFAQNVTASAVNLTVRISGVIAWYGSVPANDSKQLPRLPVAGSVVVDALASTGAAINITGSGLRVAI
jgi:hypothetical protein